MNNEHESDLTIPYVKVGDYYLPNFEFPPDAGDIGFWGRRRRTYHKTWYEKSASPMCDELSKLLSPHTQAARTAFYFPMNAKSCWIFFLPKVT